MMSIMRFSRKTVLSKNKMGWVIDDSRGGQLRMKCTGNFLLSDFNYFNNSRKTERQENRFAEAVIRWRKHHLVS